jgi:BASS family bile acid:Na+ symporter
MRLGAVISVAIPVITFVLMGVVGSDLKGEDFRRLLRRSRLVWAGWLVPPLVLPPLAVGLIVLLRPPEAIAMGLLLVASCPVGGISNAFTYLAAGTTTLSVLLTALSCLTAVVTMPTIGAALGVVGHQAIAAAPPVPALFAHLLLAVAVPASLGLFARTCWPATTERLRPAAWRLAVALLALLIALIILNDVPAFLAALPNAVPLAVCFIAASLAIGAGVAWALGAHWPDGVALAIEFATRNVAVATMAAVTVMGRIEFAIFGTAYFLTEVPLMVAAAAVLRAVARRRAGQGSVRGSAIER